MPRMQRSSFSEHLEKRALSPVIEIHDTTDAVTPTDSRTSSPRRPASRRQASEAASTLHHPLNFSRPRPVQRRSEQDWELHSSRTQSFDSQLSKPSPGRLQEQQREHESEILGATSDAFLWDTHLQDMQPRLRFSDKHAVTHEKQAQSLTDTSSGASRHTAAHSSEDECDWDGEDGRSHHTISEAGDTDQDPSWSETSSQDSSREPRPFTEAELKKLRKKGISPALYLEMKQARRGKRKWLNPLAGNSYLA